MVSLALLVARLRRGALTKKGGNALKTIGPSGRRIGALVICLGLILVIGLSSVAQAKDSRRPAAASITSSREFRVFERRLCRGYYRQAQLARPPLLRFEDAYNEPEHTAENMKLAGEALNQTYRIWRSFSKRLLAIPAPVGYRRLWHRYGKEEWAVLRLGTGLVGALLADDDPRFRRLEHRNVRLQTRRNRTWDRLGIVCSWAAG